MESYAGHRWRIACYVDIYPSNVTSSHRPKEMIDDGILTYHAHQQTNAKRIKNKQISIVIHPYPHYPRKLQDTSVAVNILLLSGWHNDWPKRQSLMSSREPSGDVISCKQHMSFVLYSFLLERKLFTARKVLLEKLRKLLHKNATKKNKTHIATPIPVIGDHVENVNTLQLKLPKGCLWEVQ